MVISKTNQDILSIISQSILRPSQFGTSETIVKFQGNFDIAEYSSFRRFPQCQGLIVKYTTTK